MLYPAISVCIIFRSALDLIGRSPFLPLWNLHKVELFSAFISHLDDDISSWKWNESESLFNLKEKKIDRNSRIRTHDPDDPVSFTALKKKEPNQFQNSV